MATIGVGRTGPSGHSSRGLIIGIAAGLAAIGIAVLIALIAVFAMNRGGSSTADTASAQGGQAPAAANAGQQSAQGGDFKRPEGAVRIGDMLFTVVSVKTLDIKPPEAHLKYVAVELTAQNVGQISQESWIWRLIDSDGHENIVVMSNAEIARLGELGKQSDQFTVSGLNPGDKTQGPLIYKVLADAKLVQLRAFSEKMGVAGVIPLK